MSDDCSILPMRDYCPGESARVVCKDIACPPPALPGPPPGCCPCINPSPCWLCYLLLLLVPLVICVLYKLCCKRRPPEKPDEIDLDKAPYPPTVCSSRRQYSLKFLQTFRKSKEIPNKEELSKKASCNKGLAGPKEDPKKAAAAGPKCTSTTEDERSGFKRASGAGKLAGAKNEAGVRPRSIANNGSGSEKEAKVRPQSIANNARVKPHPQEPSKKDNRGSTVKEDNKYENIKSRQAKN